MENPTSKKTPRARCLGAVAMPARSVEEQVQDDQHDCRHAQDPGQEIFAHDRTPFVSN
jgi:hypothetical protein